ncbi:hypothetical protein ACRBEV_29465 [Methylobacterium phyllosphaerae]
MPRFSVKLAGDGTHTIMRDHAAIACGMSLDEAENFVTFLRVSARVRRTHCLPEALRRRGAPAA